MKRSRKNSVVRSEGEVEHTAEKVRKLNKVRGNGCVVKLTVFQCFEGFFISNTPVKICKICYRVMESVPRKT